MLKNMVKTDHT